MQTLNLIHLDKSDISYKRIQFPDGQPHLKIDTNFSEKAVKIITRLANPSDLFVLQLAKAVMEDCGVTHCDLDITYLMAARMDRVMTDGEPMALRVVADTINALNFNQIRIFDPHSDVATALIRRSRAITNVDFIKKTVETLDNQDLVLIAPDAGALKKTYNVSQAIGGIQVIECTKKRNLNDGSLSGFKVFATDLTGKTCLITDDICDGGGTFAGIGAELKKLNAAKVILAVSHGIFSKGFEIANVDLVFTTDSYQDFGDLPSHIKVMNWE
jgi:ribose-phosphate pyrophosphokinase